jgi:hypothetical protein
VETYVSWFSGYSPVGVNSEYCMGTVTKASNKTIFEIDCKPAAEVYQEVRDAHCGRRWYLLLIVFMMTAVARCRLRQKPDRVVVYWLPTTWQSAPVGDDD